MELLWIILGGAIAGFAVNRVQGSRFKDVIAAGLGVAVTLTIYLALTILPVVLSILWKLVIIFGGALLIFAIYVYFTRER